MHLPVELDSYVLKNMLDNSQTPLYKDEQEAKSAGNAYDSNYYFSERDELMREAMDNKDPSLWPIIFFLDSVSR